MPKFPPVVEMFGRQIAVGLGKVASKAIVSAAKSVTNDVHRVGKNIQRSAEKTGAKLDALINPNDQDDERD